MRTLTARTRLCKEGGSSGENEEVTMFVNNTVMH
jgi:hypothetical protein